MFEIGDLVKIVESPFFIDGEEIGGYHNAEMLDKIGFVLEKDIKPETTTYLISVTREDGVTMSYYYYEHELERAE